MWVEDGACLTRKYLFTLALKKEGRKQITLYRLVVCQQHKRGIPAHVLFPKDEKGMTESVCVTPKHR